MSRDGKLFFMDDSNDRFEALYENLSDACGFIYWSPSVQDALDTLGEPITFKVVMLDHDMGEEQCGCVVVDWIVQNKNQFRGTKFIMHSWNPDAAKVMHETLVAAGLDSQIKPFNFRIQS